MRNSPLIFPELSYVLTGICFQVQNELGRFCREKQYGDSIEKRLKELKIPYKRELIIADSGNTVDFLIDNKVILELKTKRVLTKEDYVQVQRYLQTTGIKLGLLVNFRQIYLKPVRVIRIDTKFGEKFRASRN